jgi:hypothetical protein
MDISLGSRGCEAPGGSLVIAVVACRIRWSTSRAVPVAQPWRRSPAGCRPAQPQRALGLGGLSKTQFKEIESNRRVEGIEERV